MCVFSTLKLNIIFIRDHVQKGTINLQFISIDGQLENIFIKLLVEDRFKYLREV